MSVEEYWDKVAAGAANVDGDVPQCEVPSWLEPALNDSQTIGHLQSYHLITSLPHSLRTYLHFGFDLPTGEVATISTGLKRVQTHDLGDGL